MLGQFIIGLDLGVSCSEDYSGNRRELHVNVSVRRLTIELHFCLEDINSIEWVAVNLWLVEIM